MAKHEYDKILTRLTKILSRLNEGEALSVKELAEEFNVSTKTIQRDFNEKLVGLYPIYPDKKRWKMQDGFKIEKTKSLEDEIVLDIIEKITEGIGGTFSAKAHKLLSKIKNEDFNPIYTKLNIEDISDRLEDIQILETAIREKKETKCSYNDEKHDVYTTTIQPLKIVNFEGFWYLIALRNDILKKYYLKNIMNPVITDKIFTTDSKLDTLLDNSISIWFEKDEEPIEVKLYADKSAAKYFKRRPLPSQKLDSLNTDGTMEFSVTITHEMEILPIIKYWIPHLYVLEPVWIRDMVEEDLKEYTENIKNLMS